MAASSMRGPLTELAAQFTTQTGDQVQLVFGATGTLAAQIRAGAPVDVFIAADTGTIWSLERDGLLVDSTATVFASGTLVMITSRCLNGGRCQEDSALNSLTNADNSVIAIANPDYAPYGVAARQALGSAKLLPVVQRKLVAMASVEQATQTVISGNADAGLVALSSVPAEYRTRGAYTVVGQDLYAPILHAAAVVHQPGPGAAARAKTASQPADQHPGTLHFMQLLSGKTGAAILHAHGLTALAHSADDSASRTPMVRSR